MSSSPLPPETNEILFILECLQALVHDRPPESDASGLDWNAVVRLAREQRVSGLLGYVLKKNGLWGLCAPAARETLEKAMSEYGQRTAEKKLQLQQIQSLCKDLNIPFIPYKGAALALTVYKDFPFRFMSDVDFFIREKDVPILYQRLLALGFERPLFPYPNRWQREILRKFYATPSGRESLVKNGWDLDIHRLAKYHVADDIAVLDMRAIWARASQRTTEFGEVLFLDDGDHAQLLLCHAAELFEPHFIQIVDVLFLMKKYALRKSAVMSRCPESLGRSARAFLDSILDAVEEFLSPQKRSGNFSPETRAVFNLFFYKQKRIYKTAIAPSGWRRMAQSLKALPGIRKKLLFAAGFFVPNPEYYHPLGIKGLPMYFHHAKRLVKRVLSASLE